jgi:hypothetical protein
MTVAVAAVEGNIDYTQGFLNERLLLYQPRIRVRDSRSNTRSCVRVKREV